MRVALVVVAVVFASCSKPSGSPQGGAPPASSSAASAAATTAVVDAGSPSEQVNYDGPMGLKWEQSPEEVKKQLAERRITFVREITPPPEGTVEQHYKGEFSGLVAQTIAATFHEGKLIAVAVLFPSEDIRPASKTWEVLVEKMKEVRGEPTHLEKMPRKVVASVAQRDDDSRAAAFAALSGAANEAVNSYEAMDLKIKSGAWEPMAVWRFKNKAAAVVGVKVGDPNRYGDRPLGPIMVFRSPSYRTWYDKLKDPAKSDL